MIGYRDLSPDVPLALDCGIQEFYSDGIATLEALGPNFRATYYTWGKLPGSTVMTRIPVVRITRPLISVLGASGDFGSGGNILKTMRLGMVHH